MISLGTNKTITQPINIQDEDQDVRSGVGETSPD